MNHKDMKLYGECPDQGVFSVVTCYSCGMVLRPQAFNDHIRKRHGTDSLSDEITIPLEMKSEEFSPSTDSGLSSEQDECTEMIERTCSVVNPAKNSYPVSSSNKFQHLRPTASEPAMKRQRTEPNIESYPLGHSPAQILEEAESFYLPNPPKKRVAHKPKQLTSNLKVKFKKIDQGEWRVVKT